MCVCTCMYIPVYSYIYIYLIQLSVCTWCIVEYYIMYSHINFYYKPPPSGLYRQQQPASAINGPLPAAYYDTTGTFKAAIKVYDNRVSYYIVYLPTSYVRLFTSVRIVKTPVEYTYYCYVSFNSDFRSRFVLRIHLTWCGLAAVRP